MESYNGHAKYIISGHDLLPAPSAQRKGSWVVERVVGSGELRTPDDSLREQMKRLQITSEV